MKLLWITDPHLNFLNKTSRHEFYRRLFEAEPDAIVITGDIAEANTICSLLIEMQKALKCKIYFVAGNHDYYGGSVENVGEELKDLTYDYEDIFWLPELGVSGLTVDTMLVGVDGWADGRYGDYHGSPVVLNDSIYIEELLHAVCTDTHVYPQHTALKRHKRADISSKMLLNKMQQLADADASMLSSDLSEACDMKSVRKVIVATHVPPFKNSAMYGGEISDKNYLPFFTSKATGDVLLEHATKHPDIEFTVLCGHTHGAAHYQALPNLLVRTGKAKYYYPDIVDVLII